MTKGWSVGLLFALILLLIARYFLHVGGFWDLALFRALERRSPQLAILLTVVSLRDLQDMLPGARNPIVTAILWLARGAMLLCALALALLAGLVLATVFFGGPL